jgi:deoxyribonuclease V
LIDYNRNRLPTTPAAAIRQQKQIAKKVIATDEYDKVIKLVCGVDVSYRNGIAHCSAVVMNIDDLSIVVEQAATKSEIKNPYIPGLFILREAGPILHTIRRLKCYDILLVDGNGLLHPRRCGLACHIGVIADKPAIGVAKSLLCGSVRDDNYVELEGEIIGYRIAKAHKSLYVSIGHKVSLNSAVSIIERVTKKGEWLPEPLRLADTYSKL